MPRLALLAALALLGLSVAACGATQPTKTVTVEASAPVKASKPSSAKPHPSAKSSSRKLASRAATSGAVARAACDQNITAKVGTTSCAFAENVFWAFWNAREAGETTFTAFSPATQRDYDLSCTTASMVTCRAGDGAEVRFPIAAVQAYTQTQADRYAATHNTGEAPTPDPAPASAPRAPAGGGTDCDPNYEGECLDPNMSDYDCEGGEGDGPGYTGQVEVVGDDHYDLDRDGDGIACDV